MITVDKFNVRVVNKGDKFGRDFCLTHESEKPMVEFYDARYPHTEFGQFVHATTWQRSWVTTATVAQKVACA